MAGEGTWKSEVKDLSFERFPKLEKTGTLTFKFTDEGIFGSALPEPLTSFLQELQDIGKIPLSLS
jgi:hypothetical protein